MNRVDAVLRLACCAVAAALLGWAAQAASAEDYRIENTEGKHLDVLAAEGKPIVRYVYLREEGDGGRATFDTAKVFLHVFADDGKTTLTKGPGGKFPHHRGIFIGWSRLQHDGKRHDLWHVRNTEQRHKSFLATEAGPEAATLQSAVVWIGTDGEPVLDETRTHRIVACDDAHAVIDFTSELRAGYGAVKLDGDPEHAGCQFRPSQEVAENNSARYTFHAEGVDPTKDLDLPWVAETFRLGEQEWTVEMMNHPDNPDGARWSAYRSYGRFGPFTVVEIEDGGTQVFRYRFRITKGPAPDRKALAAAYKAYVAD